MTRMAAVTILDDELVSFMKMSAQLSYGLTKLPRASCFQFIDRSARQGQRRTIVAAKGHAKTGVLDLSGADPTAVAHFLFIRVPYHRRRRQSAAPTGMPGGSAKASVAPLSRIKCFWREAC